MSQKRSRDEEIEAAEARGEIAGYWNTAKAVLVVIGALWVLSFALKILFNPFLLIMLVGLSVFGMWAFGSGSSKRRGAVRAEGRRSRRDAAADARTADTRSSAGQPRRGRSAEVVEDDLDEEMDDPIQRSRRELDAFDRRLASLSSVASREAKIEEPVRRR